MNISAPGLRELDEPADRKERLRDLAQFYWLLTRLELATGGRRKLGETHGRMPWPLRGVYFFFEPGETRNQSGSGLRVVRVGTHALKPDSQTKLWSRLSQHRGSAKTGGGNHRGSIFRLLVGQAMIARGDVRSPTWGRGSSASKDVRAVELEAERAVSKYLAQLELVCLPINDEPGPDSVRGFVERNAIALLSNIERDALDAASENWLGRRSDRPLVRSSGLWNNEHTCEKPSRKFLPLLATLIARVEDSA